MARSGLRRLVIAGGLAIVSVLVSGCSWADLPRFGWPESRTAEGQHMLTFWSATFIAALVIGGFTWGLMFWSFAFHRKKKGSPLYPKQTKENLPLEIVYTAIPFLLVIGLFYFVVDVDNKVLGVEQKAAVTVKVTAFKWNWDFAYIGADGTPIKDANNQEVHTIGTSEEIPILMLPTNQVIEYQLEAKDVIHSFWVPEYLFKRDVFPAPEVNQVEQGNIFQNVITQEGAMVGRCAEFCGQYHAMMNFEVRGVPQSVFDSYIAKRQQINPATNRGFTTAEALASLNCGELCAPEATTTHPFDTRRTADNIIAGGK